jgi:hypothetical protein
MLYRIKDRKVWARVHFIPDLKIGEFVTLRTPYVLNSINNYQHLDQNMVISMSLGIP